MATLKISDLIELTELSSDSGNNYFIVANNGSSYKIDYADIVSSIHNDIYGYAGIYPYTDAVELDYSWSELQAMCESGTYDGIRVGDYITESINGTDYTIQIAGIDNRSYQYIGDSTYITHNIDFVSKECWEEPIQWSTTGTNNGTSTENRAYLVSNIYDYLNNTVYNYLSSDLVSCISERAKACEYRYDGTDTATSSCYTSTLSSDGYTSDTIGYLWVPSEYDVLGYDNFSNMTVPEYDQKSQLPIFRGGWATRIKTAANSSEYVTWWLHSIRDGDSTSACCIAPGYSSYADVSSTDIYVPICFSIQEFSVKADDE